MGLLNKSTFKTFLGLCTFQITLLFINNKLMFALIGALEKLLLFFNSPTDLFYLSGSSNTFRNIFTGHPQLIDH